tara:strand:+ start:6301 stop:7353 length:1053 start_codon:yes stop_codon:yes gene_type:complete
LEDNYIESFIEHYLNLGFDYIVILYAINNKHIPRYMLDEKYKDKVLLYKVDNEGNKLRGKYIHLIPSNIDWILTVDSDEYLILNKKYNSIQDYVDKNYKDENVNVIIFYWILLHKLKENNNDTLYDIFKKYKQSIGYDISNINTKLSTTERRNKSENIYCKCMFKNTKNISWTNTHGESMGHIPNINETRYILDNNGVIYEDDSNCKISSINCNNTNYYDESFLLHIESRSLNDIIRKSICNHPTMNSKKKSDRTTLKKFVKNTNNFEYKYLLGQLKNIIGYKLKYAYDCKNDINNIVNLNIDNYNINKKSLPLNLNKYNLFKNIDILNDEKFIKISNIISENDDKKFMK